MTEFSVQKIGEGLLNITIQTAFNDIPELEQIALAVVQKNKNALNLYKKMDLQNMDDSQIILNMNANLKIGYADNLNISPMKMRLI